MRRWIDATPFQTAVRKAVEEKHARIRSGVRGGCENGVDVCVCVWVRKQFAVKRVGIVILLYLGRI
jgi:hypothetical protein